MLPESINKELVIQDFIEKYKIEVEFKKVALNWFIPLAERLYFHQQGASSPFFCAVNGAQGSGKSTLVNFIQYYLSHCLNLKVVTLSLDDFYLDQIQRQQLSQKVHPLLATRGVPGTHDVTLMSVILSQLEKGKTGFKLPRFNKATDNPFAVELWPEVNEKVDVVLFEGWCWGVWPQPEWQLQQPLNSLERDEDNDRKWRHYVNDQIRRFYTPLYKMMDYWIMLRAPDFSCIYNWRVQQEEHLRQMNLGYLETPAIMDNRALERFILHFQRLTEHALQIMPNQCDVVLQLDADRHVTHVHGRDLEWINNYAPKVEQEVL